MKASIKLGQKLTTKHKIKQITRIRLASFIELGEKNFSEYVREVEKDPIFIKLLSPDDENRRVITCKSFPMAVFELSNIAMEEELSCDRSPVDVETLLSGKSGITTLIKKVGLVKFEKYFLGCEALFSASKISADCGISVREVENLREFLDELSVRSEFFHPSGLAPESRLDYAKIAEIEYDGKSDFLINFYSHKYVSGRYIINNVKLSALKKKEAFYREENQRIGKLLEKIELINARKSTIFQILRRIIQVQKNYLYSGDEKFLVPYTQKRLSEDIGMDNSVVCRAIYGRSIVTPHKVEKPLKFFIPRSKTVRKILIKKIIENEPIKLTDNMIVQVLKNKFSINISRRTVNVCRNELAR